jgi:hypothetical protein
MDTTPSDDEDHVDKGAEGMEKKFGASMGQTAEKNRGVNEGDVSFPPLRHSCALTDSFTGRRHSKIAGEDCRKGCIR